MKMIGILILAGFFIFPCILFSQTVQEQDMAVPVAVIDFDAPDISASARITLSNMVRKELVNLKSYIVVDRNNMNEILDEQGFQQSGLCTNVECMVQVGRLLGVRKIIGGSIGALGRRYVVDLKIVDVETGRIEIMESEDHFGSLESIDVPVILLTRRLVSEDGSQGKSTQIYVSSEPAGAAVYINGIHKGTAPIKIPVEQEGDYLVEATMSGYPNWKKKVTVNRHETALVSVNFLVSRTESPYQPVTTPVVPKIRKPERARFIGGLEVLYIFDSDQAVFGANVGARISSHIGLNFKYAQGTKNPDMPITSRYFCGGVLWFVGKSLILNLQGGLFRQDFDFKNIGYSESHFYMSLHFLLKLFETFYLTPGIGTDFQRVHIGMGFNVGL